MKSVIPIDYDVSLVVVLFSHGHLPRFQVLPEFDFSAHKYFPVVKII